MTINLHDIPVAVKTYLDSSVPVSITIHPVGTEINTNEPFTVTVKVDNNGNVDLAKVRYHVKVDDPAIATVAPPASSAFGLDFVFPSSQDAKTLAAGKSDQITFSGKAGTMPASTKIEARISADPDFGRGGTFIAKLLQVNPTT